MNNKQYRFIVILMIWSIVFATFSGCSSRDMGKTGDNEKTAEGQKKDSPYDKLPREISVTCYDRGAVPNEEGSYEDNRWTRWVNENSGVKVKWIPIDNSKYYDKLNVLIAADQAPDIIGIWNRPNLAQLVSQEAIQPVDEYVEKYSTAYKNYLAKNPELKEFLTFDKKMYALTNKRGIDNIANHGMWIRQDWLEKLNLKTPMTDEELLQVAKAFVEMDPDGNGVKDTYAFSNNGVYWDLLMNQLYMTMHSWYVEDGKMQYSRTTDRFRDVMLFQKRQFDGGMIDKEYVTDTNASRSLQFWVTGKSGIRCHRWPLADYSELKKNNPGAKLLPLEPVSTKYGKSGFLQEALAHRYLVLNKNIKNPKAAIEFLDWMMDKGWFTLEYGLEGVHYKLVDGIPKDIDLQKNKLERDYAKNNYALLLQWDPKPDYLIKAAAEDPLSQEIARLNSLSLTVAMKNNFRRDIMNEPVFPEQGDFWATLNPKIDQIKTRVITGGSQYSADWGIEEIRKEWKRLGGDKVQQTFQKWYEEKM